jgi:hypothetical protein
MPQLDKNIASIEESFRIIQSTFNRLGTTEVTPPQPKRNRLKKMMDSVKKVLNISRKPVKALPNRVYHRVLGDPVFEPAHFMGNNELRLELLQVAHLYLQSKSPQATPLEDKCQKIVQGLSRSLSTGQLADYLAFYKMLEGEGVSSSFGRDMTNSIAFYSSDTGSDLATDFANTGGTRSWKLPSFDLVVKMSKPMSGGGRIAAQKPTEKDDEIYETMFLQMLAIQSSLYATLASGDIICFMPQGLSIGNIFWNNELPILRRLQTLGIVDRIMVYAEDKAPAAVDVSQGGDQRSAWFEKCIALTSRSVKMSIRHEWGHWIECKFEADAALRFLLASHYKQQGSRLVLYAYRLQSGGYARFDDVAENRQSIRLIRPADPDDIRSIEVLGHSIDRAMQTLPTIERFLMANYNDFQKLPKAPSCLAFAGDAFFQEAGGNLTLLAVKVDGAWLYTPTLKMQLQQKNVGADVISQLLDGTHTNGLDAHDLQDRADAVRFAMKMPPGKTNSQPVKPIRNLIGFWEDIARQNKPAVA